jgi:radical SAM superfamily enzyme YgiQ (UPF0313 family)
MFGLLGDTKETMRETINFSKSLDLDIASFNITTPYPGTRLYEEIKNNGKFLVDDWGIFHHTSGKMIYTHPSVASPEEVEEAYRKAHKEFYLRPKYILRQILKIRSFNQLKVMLRGVKTVLKVS